MQIIRTLAIETSCDDTSVAIVSFDGKTFSVEKILAYSQVKDHQKYGGVVPEVASRLHSEKIIEVLNGIGRENIESVDFICLTTHPGLPGSLVVGRATASLLAEWFQKELVSVNHIHGHIFSLFLDRDFQTIKFPMSVLTASGGHNDIYKIQPQKQNPFHKIFKSKKLFPDFSVQKIGRSIDDAAGEAFDKVARMLGGPYPGGPWISQKAAEFDPNYKIPDIDLLQKLGSGKFFRRVRLDKDQFDFSFSGVKSQVHNLVSKLKQKNIELTPELISCIAYEFQESVTEVLTTKLLNSASQNTKTVAISGGVSANDRRRELLQEMISQKNLKLESLRPAKKLYSTDNAAMIGVVGIMQKIGCKIN